MLCSEKNPLVKWGAKRGGTYRTLCVGILLSLSCPTIGCGTPAAPAKVVVPVPHVPQSASPVAKPVQVRVPPLPDEWTTGLAVACQWTSDQIQREVLLLRTSPQARPFATIKSTEDIRVRLPVGNADQGLEVRARADGFVLNGLVLPKELALYIAKSTPITRDQTVLLSDETPLHSVSAAAGQVEFEFEIPPGVRLANPRARGNRKCADLGISFTDFDLPKSKGYLETNRPGSLVLTATPGGRLSIDIQEWCKQDAHCGASVVESRGTFRRVAVDTESIVLLGWVNRDRFDTEDLSQAGTFGGRGLLSHLNFPTIIENGSVRSPDAPAAAICAWNAPLIIQDKGARRIQGLILANTPFERISTEDGFVEIRAPKAFASPPDVRWFVPEAYVYSCGGKE